LPLGRRLVSARRLVGGPRPLPRGGHSRRRSPAGFTSRA
jgi:hypothetical protein